MPIKYTEPLEIGAEITHFGWAAHGVICGNNIYDDSFSTYIKTVSGGYGNNYTRYLVDFGLAAATTPTEVTALGGEYRNYALLEPRRGDLSSAVDIGIFYKSGDHIYRDANGKCWLINIKGDWDSKTFTTTGGLIDHGVYRVTVTLIKQFGLIGEEATQYDAVLASQTYNISKGQLLTWNLNAYTIINGLSPQSPVTVFSLPNGSEAMLCARSYHIGNTTEQGMPLVIGAKVAFSGNGPDGISATITKVYDCGTDHVQTYGEDPPPWTAYFVPSGSEMPPNPATAYTTKTESGSCMVAICPRANNTWLNVEISFDVSYTITWNPYTTFPGGGTLVSPIKQSDTETKTYTLTYGTRSDSRTTTGSSTIIGGGTFARLNSDAYVPIGTGQVLNTLYSIAPDSASQLIISPDSQVAGGGFRRHITTAKIVGVTYNPKTGQIFKTLSADSETRFFPF